MFYSLRHFHNQDDSMNEWNILYYTLKIKNNWKLIILLFRLKSASEKKESKNNEIITINHQNSSVSCQVAVKTHISLGKHIDVMDLVQESSEQGQSSRSVSCKRGSYWHRPETETTEV